MCSIMVASLGLDLDSPAVIIGAMLISPLMSPILGIGLGIGVNDKETLVISLKHFGISIGIALFTSFIYFKLTPFGSITDEIMSRTSPTLLDGMVAIFGGLAGVISITRLDKSNAIPGVAIATALMPPLCVAGFGLANGEWRFFLNAFYLFFLNSFFIAITTYIIIRLLRFPYKKHMNDKEVSRSRLYILVFSLILLIPAIYILYNTVKKTQERHQVDLYLKDKISDEETILSEWTFVEDAETRERDSIQLVLKIIGEPLSAGDLELCDTELETLLGKPVNILTYQSEEIQIDDIDKLQKQLPGFKGEFQEKFAQLQEQKSEEIKVLSERIDSIQEANLTTIYDETKSLFPEVEELSFSNSVVKLSDKSGKEAPAVFVRWKSDRRTSKPYQKLEDFLAIRFQRDSLEVVHY